MNTVSRPMTSVGPRSRSIFWANRSLFLRPGLYVQMGGRIRRILPLPRRGA